MIFKNNMNVLDAGCGAGELTLRLLNHTKKVISFDISKNMLQQILERAPKTDFTIINFCTLHYFWNYCFHRTKIFQK